MSTSNIIKLSHILTALMLCCGAVGAAPDIERLQQADYAEDMESELVAALSGHDEFLAAAEKFEGDVAAVLSGHDEFLADAEKFEGDLTAVLSGYDEVLEDAPGSSD